jgi:hypothetical protein
LWQKACLVCVKPWVQFPILKERERERQTDRDRETKTETEIVDKILGLLP